LGERRRLRLEGEGLWTVKFPFIVGLDVCWTGSVWSGSIGLRFQKPKPNRTEPIFFLGFLIGLFGFFLIRFFRLFFFVFFCLIGFFLTPSYNSFLIGNWIDALYTAGTKVDSNNVFLRVQTSKLSTVCLDGPSVSKKVLWKQI
jgi:hypothetical protein